MSFCTSSLLVLIPAVGVTAGWLIAIKRRAPLRWRMALFTAALAVFLLGAALSLAGYRKFSLDVKAGHTLEAMHGRYPDLVAAVSTLKVSALAFGANLLLASLACQFSPPRRTS
jgi:hypothetical protein